MKLDAHTLQSRRSRLIEATKIETLCDCLIWKLEHAPEHNYSIRVTKRDIALLIELLTQRKFLGEANDQA